MITLHSHIQPQYKYELFHIYFSLFTLITRPPFIIIIIVIIIVIIIIIIINCLLLHAIIERV